jgi:hypothetical protein
MGNEGASPPGLGGAGGADGKGRQGLFKALVDGVRNGVAEMGSMAGMKRPRDRFE